MKKFQLLALIAFLASAAAAQQTHWHKIIPRTPVLFPFCHLRAEGEHFLLAADNGFAELDQLGALTGHFTNPSGSTGFWTAVLKKYDIQTGHPYFIVVRRKSIAKDIVLEQYEPGTGFLHETVFADSLGSVKWSRPQLISLDDSSFVIFGRQFYRKVIFSKATGFVEKWVRPLDFSPTAAVYHQQQFILADESGRMAALDENGNTPWSRQHAFGFHALHPVSGGFIGCGVSTDGKAAIIRLAADGSEIWNQAGIDLEYFDVVPAADGGFAATGVSAASNILLARYSANGALQWSREFGTGMGVSILQTSDGGFAVMARGQPGLHLIKTDADGHAPAAETTPFRERMLATNTLQATFQPNETLFANDIGTGLISLADSGATLAFAFSPWIAGKDANQELHLSASEYAQYFPGDFRPGLVDAPANDFNRVWKVTRTEINAVRRDWGDNQGMDEPVPLDLLSWPGKGNPNLRYNLDFTPVQTDPEKFPAPFVDVNSDGRYNAYDGDYPRIQGDQMLWWALTDSAQHNQTHGNPLLIDVFTSVFAYDCVDNPKVDQSLFVNYLLHNRSAINYSDTRLGFFADVDLGCFNDDYFGTLPGSNAFYAYNADAVDTDCGGLSTQFGTNIPVESITMLNQSLDKSAYFNNPSYNNPPVTSHDPELPFEYYWILQGLWNDGTPLTRGGSGYNPNSTDYMDFAFPDNPADPQGWSMCSVVLPIYDRRFVPSHGPFNFEAGSTFDMRLAFTMHRDIPLPCPDIFGLVQPPLTQIQQWDGAGAFDLNPGLEPVYFLAPGQTLQLDASVAQGMYLWSTGAATANINVNAPGIYSVTITGATGCSKTETVEVRKSASAGNPLTPDWRLWPNPTTDLVQIQTAAGSADAFSSRLFDAQGRLVAWQTGKTIDLSRLPAGLYWVELRDGETGLGVRKVVKE